MAGRRRRIAIAGLGAAARDIHLPAIRALRRRLELVGGCDPAPARAPGLEVFDDLEEMLAKTRPEVLVVAAPPPAHFELVRRALEAGCHVFCEKPFMPTLEEALEVVELAERTGRRLAVNQQYRFMACHRAAYERLGREGFGELLFLEARQCFRTSAATEAGWRGQDPQRTLKEFGTHVLDLCRFFFGEEAERISARMPRPGGRPELLDLVRLDFPGQRSAQLTLDRLGRGRHRYLELRLDGSEGTIESRLGGRAELAFGVRGGDRRPFLELDVAAGGRSRLYRGERFRKLAADPLDLFAAATRRLLEAFLDALDADRAPPCDGRDNLRTLALMLAAYESDRLGGELELSWGEVPSWRPAGGGGR